MNLKIQWISEKWREGSMGEADKKTYFIACGVFTVILILCYGVLFFNWFHTLAYLNFQAASGILKFVSVSSAIFSFYGLWKAPDVMAGEKNGWIAGALFIGSLALSWLCAYVEDWLP